MSAALVIVLVAVGDGDDPSTRAMSRTTEEVLGDHSMVLVREVEAMPSDADAGLLASTTHATAIVELGWSSDRREARVRVRATEGTWTERTVTFHSGDPPGERGRLLAYAVATMVPPPVDDAPSSKSALSPPAKGAPVVARASVAPFFGWIGLSIERAGDGAIERRTYGASLRAAYMRAGERFGVGVGVTFGGRVGAIDAADATSSTLHGGLGPIVAVRLARYVGLGISAELGAAHVAIARTGVGGDGRFLPTVSGTLETVLGPERAAVVLGVGLTHMLGKTDVFVGDAHLGSLARTRVLLGLGVRLRF